MEKIKLQPDEVIALTALRDSKDYPAAYDYISSIIRKNPEFDQSTAFWFEKAKQINRNVRSDPADVYIRSATACGLRWDSKLSTDRVANARMLQQTSDNIGFAVLNQVVTAQAISTVNVFLNQDIVGALASGQTIGGWGGALYYWNAPFVAPGTTQITTVGDYIRTHPAEYEKFITCNAAAASDAIWETQLPGLTPSATIPGRADAIVLARAKLLFDGLAVNSQAQAPQWAKDEIQSRVVRLATGGSAAGSPDNIADYNYHGGTWWESSFLNAPIPGVISLVPIPAPVRDADVIKQLNARRAIRIEHQSFTPVPGG